MKRIAAWLIALAATLAVSGCGYNSIQSADEATKSAWSEVLIAVTEARSRVGQIRVDPTDPASLQQFESAQRDMGSALSRLLVVAENYPQLKSDANFRDLQTQLEGTENRINVARIRFNDAVREYNATMRMLPWNLVAGLGGFQRKAYFRSEEEARRAPDVTMD